MDNQGLVGGGEMGEILPGKAYPLGATVVAAGAPGASVAGESVAGDRVAGVNFSFFSQNATRVELLLFENDSAPEPYRVIELDPAVHRTFYYWHVLVPGIGHGQVYGLRVHGPHDPARGMRFDGEKVLVDPYAKAISRKLYDRGAACRPGDNCAQAMRSVVVDPSRYDWEDDAPVQKRLERTVIYEMHVGGFTKHPESGVAAVRRGTFLGLIEKIPYLKELGINAVELLPVYQFDPADAPANLTNYWGYAPVGFFAPHDGYGTAAVAAGLGESGAGDPTAVVDEFREMVKALHKADIAVYLDVVYNHSTENGADGPMLSFRGLENVAYYIAGDSPAEYANFSGCGNTLNANHSIVRRMILDSLRYWVTEMHVDGFRFDLASAMARGEHGEPLASPPLLWEIESDPVLAGTTLIAEAWDAAGHYQVGSFIGDRFAEWNDKFRDDLRQFVKGDAGFAPKAALRMLGSPDIYPRDDRSLPRSINFITAHDGFTLNDLVSYNHKHNLANGEENRDGSNHNHSWNSGQEGETTNPAVLALRARQVRNFMTLLLLAQGTPMLLMGDEVRHTQKGNNNVYGQDNELAWFDWRGVTRQGDMLRFVQKLLAFRMEYEVLHADRPLALGESAKGPYVLFYGQEGGHVNWSENSRQMSFTFHQPPRHGAAREAVHLAANMGKKKVTFGLPDAPAGMAWRAVIDTASLEDIVAIEEAAVVSGKVEVAAHAIRVFVAG